LFFVLQCPFCGAPETDRLDVDGRRFVVFECMFTPEVNPALSDEEVAERLATDFAEEGSGYFRRLCDRLHLHVTAGEGARRLLASKGSAPNDPP
jgi:hypothetical protein